jgi:gas vesicle protein
MFPFGRKKQIDQDAANNSQKRKGRMDKLIMGAIIGVAVGSVVGMTIAPQKGKETRRIIAEKGKEAYEKSKEISSAVFHTNKKEKPVKKLFRALFGRKQKKMTSLREIPNETMESVISRKK